MNASAPTPSPRHGRLHRPLVEGVVRALQAIFEENKYADKVVAATLRSEKRWGSRDRAFVASQVYDAVRWWRLLWWLVFESDPPAPPFVPKQLTRLIGGQLLLQGWSLPPWEEFEGLELALLEKRRVLYAGRRPVAQSIPDWLDEIGSRELGTRWDAELEALNRQAPLVIRANTLRTTAERLMAELGKEGWQPKLAGLAPEAIELQQRGNVFQHPLFRKGHFEVQDTGSQCIARLLAPQPGMRVVDACAGAGGKSLHLAALMENRGQIIAMDTEDWKLEELRRRGRRNGVHIIQTRLITGTKTIKRLYDSADRLLLDVPCSGTGVLRRNPDAKWKLSPGFIEEVKTLQQHILQNYSPILRPGGRMVYATCSILPSENERQVATFLDKHPNWKLLEERHLWPSEGLSDGFYMALLEKE